MFIIEKGKVNPILEGIYNVFSESHSFEDFIVYSVLQAELFIDNFIESRAEIDYIYINFIFDDSFD